MHACALAASLRPYALFCGIAYIFARHASCMVQRLWLFILCHVILCHCCSVCATPHRIGILVGCGAAAVARRRRGARGICGGRDAVYSLHTSLITSCHYQRRGGAHRFIQHLLYAISFLFTAPYHHARTYAHALVHAYVPAPSPPRTYLRAFCTTPVARPTGCSADFSCASICRDGVAISVTISYLVPAPRAAHTHNTTSAIGAFCLSTEEHT